MEQNIVITEGVKELVLRTGTALPVVPDKPIKIIGTLPAVAQFLVGKTVVDSDCHLLIFKDLGKVELHINDTNPHTEHVITGCLKKDSVLESFKINTDHRWTVQGLIKFVRTMKYYFDKKEEADTLVDSLRKWDATIITVLKDHNDNSGNSTVMLEKKVEGVQLKKSFTLNIPIFQGYPRVKFTVEIGLDPKANSVDLYLISDELIEFEAGTKEKYIDEELAKMTTHHFSKVVVS